MLLKNGKVFYHGKLEKMDIRIEDNKIVEIKACIGGDGLDMSNKLIIPGLVDMHSHGCKGYDFSTATHEEMDLMCSHYGKNGVVAVAATGMTLDVEELKHIFAGIGDKMKKGSVGAKIVGINMEGPFLASEKKGAHDPQFIAAPDVDTFRAINQASGNNVLLVDFSPTYDGALEFIATLKDEVVLSLAHTAASYDQSMAAIKAGASNVTHLFNAMAPYLHREPGLIGAAFDSNVSAEIICDGIHIHPAVIRTAFAVLGERAVLISDSMSAAGMPEGNYKLGGLDVTVENRKAFLADGTIAGSTINVYEALCNAVSFGIPLEKAIYAATTAPAKAIRRGHLYGSLEVGRNADILILEEKTLDIYKVIIDGKDFK